mgnify:CR=1 FL=1
MHRALCIFILLLSGVSPVSLFAQDSPAPDAPLNIHILSGSREYKSQPSLEEFAKHLKENYKVTVTASWGHDGIKELEDLDALKDAELMIVFARRMKLGDEQMEIVRGHWKASKPIVGIRTASHAFSNEDNKVFDREVLGNNYTGHHGSEEVKVTPVSEQEDHPVLTGVGAIASSKLYKCGDLPETTTVLQMGDIGKASYPVTLINEYNGGRVFYTSLGVPTDFQNENFRRLLTNAIFWTCQRDPTKMKK